LIELMKIAGLREPNYHGWHCERKNNQRGPLPVLQTEQCFRHVSSHKEQEETEYVEEHEIEEERGSFRAVCAGS
jgi:hypothetical protein